MLSTTQAVLLLSLGLAYERGMVRAQGVATLDGLRSTWNLNAGDFAFPAPQSTLNSDQASSFISQNWDLARRIDWGTSDIVFSPDPSTSTSTLVRRQQSSTTSRSSRTRSSSSTASATTTQSVSSPASTDLAGEDPVLRIGYPQGSYSHRTGGTQFYATPLNDTNANHERMLLSYDVWFPTGFGWNLGGKLPGLRGGPDTRGCSGGNATDGTGCFSTRLMWRTGGAGEVYGYIPTSQKGFCSSSQVTCNSDYGTSLARGSFSFVTGQWQTIWLLVVLNDPAKANGVVELYYNGANAIRFTNLALRTSSSIASINGLFFSTFFGGDDASWATPTNQYTYFRNIHMYAGSGAATGDGAAITSAAGRSISAQGGSLGVLAGGLAVAVVYLASGL